MNRFKEIKNDINELSKTHGSPLASAIGFKETCKDVDGLISMILCGGIQAARAMQEGIVCDAIIIKTTDELNEKLKDIPENKDVWNKIYDEIPPCFMHHTIRREKDIIVVMDMNCEKGKKMAEDILKHINN